MNDFLKRTWAEINLDNLNYNISSIKSKLNPQTKLIAVVKADAYGHGDCFIADELVENGVDFFAVSNLAEALSLRKAGITCDIIILGFTPPIKASELAALGITQTVFSTEYARQLSDFAMCQKCTVKVHIKFDTGMGRIGFVENDSVSSVGEVLKLFSCSQLCITGIYSHLSSADAVDSQSTKYTRMQVERFNHVISQLKERGINNFVTHLQNSAGISCLENAEYDYARAGIVIYGVQPSEHISGIDLKPIMSLKTVISMVKMVPVGAEISYGRTFVTTHPTRIATVPMGYADGYPRLLSNRGYMLINGQKAPIIGNICMDQLMLDVSKIDNVCQGDIVTVVGRDGENEISFPEIAAIIGTIGYELMCIIGKRVPRVYFKNGERIAVSDNYSNRPSQ